MFAGPCLHLRISHTLHLHRGTGKRLCTGGAGREERAWRRLRFSRSWIFWSMYAKDYARATKTPPRLCHGEVTGYNYHDGAALLLLNVLSSQTDTVCSLGFVQSLAGESLIMSRIRHRNCVFREVRERAEGFLRNAFCGHDYKTYEAVTYLMSRQKACQPEITAITDECKPYAAELSRSSFVSGQYPGKILWAQVAQLQVHSTCQARSERCSARHHHDESRRMVQDHDTGFLLERVGGGSGGNGVYC